MGKKKKKEKTKKEKLKKEKGKSTERMHQEPKRSEKPKKGQKAATAETVQKADAAQKADAVQKADAAQKTEAAQKTGAAQKTPGRQHRTTQPQEAELHSTALVSAEEAASVFRALSDVNRVRILQLLSERELCATELLSSLDIVQSTLSHHMKVLCELGLVCCQKQGKRSCYTVNRSRAEQIISYIRKWGECEYE